MGAPWGSEGAQMILALVAVPIQWADSFELLSSLVKPPAGVAGRSLAGVLDPWGVLGVIATSLAVSAVEQYGEPVACCPVEEHFWQEIVLRSALHRLE